MNFFTTFSKAAIVALLFAIFQSVQMVNAYAEERKVENPKVEVRVDGLSCPFCAYGLEKKLKASGVMDFEVNFEKGVVSFGHKGRIEPNRIWKTVKDAGFTPRAVEVTISGKTIPSEGDGDGAVKPVAFKLESADQTLIVVADEKNPGAFAKFLEIAEKSAKPTTITGTIVGPFPLDEKSGVKLRLIAIGEIESPRR